VVKDEFDWKKNYSVKKIIVTHQDYETKSFYLWCKMCGVPKQHDVIQREYSGDVSGFSQLRTCTSCNYKHRLDWLEGDYNSDEFKERYLSWK
jgi:hypothetical protein